jgi:predicted nicotinamide N-methyase
MSYELFNEKVFTFDEDQISVDLQYIETLAPSDALALLDGIDYTGFKLWPGSTYLCETIVKHKALFEGKTLLELGSGVGLAGLVASQYAKEPVLLTDGEDYIVDVLKKNVARNGLESKVKAATLYWGKDEKKFLETYPDGFEVIMGGDVVYMTELIHPLLSCISTLLAPGGVFFMVYVQRSSTTLGPRFLEEATKAPYNLTSTVTELDVKIDEAATFLYQLHKVI